MTHPGCVLYGGGSLGPDDMRLLERCGIAEHSDRVAVVFAKEPVQRRSVVVRSPTYGDVRVVGARSKDHARAKPLLVPMAAIVSTGCDVDGALMGEASAAAFVDVAPETVCVPQCIDASQSFEVWQHFDGRPLVAFEGQRSEFIGEALRRVLSWRQCLEAGSQRGDQATITLRQIVGGFLAERPDWLHDATLVSLANGVVDRLVRYVGGSSVATPVGFVHGDLSFGNILCAADGRTTAIVDFEHARFGPSVIDELALRANAVSRIVRRSASRKVYSSWLQQRTEDYANLHGRESAALVDALVACWVLLAYLPYQRTTRFAREPRALLWPAARAAVLRVVSHLLTLPVSSLGCGRVG